METSGLQIKYYWMTLRVVTVVERDLLSLFLGVTHLAGSSSTTGPKRISWYGSTVLLVWTYTFYCKRT